MAAMTAYCAEVVTELAVVEQLNYGAIEQPANVQ